MKNKRELIILVALIFFIVGVLASGLFFQLKIKQLRSQYAADDAKTAAANKIFIPAQMMGITGKVIKIEGNNLTVKVVFPGGEKDYSVKVADNAKIVKKELTKENVASATAETPINLSDIKENDAILAIASEDIKDKTEFEAKALTIMVLPSVLTPSPNTTTGK